ncbi:pseudouridine synthase [Pedobacter hiemivivus]|uniref:Pseudouridine synthase n=1 Tax=Pedobacter hiemivivus TaxID=2530454 RepID=A0A4R0N873_9SPHI|nr:pseudouridine synthase [Pedobacter hiemivivus]TCC95533.1 rRNA pseudouridine synthase [Pedobacter hiemivivus]
MIKNNNRNSRDDKSKPGNRSTTGKRPGGAESSYKGKSKFDDKEGKDNKFGDAKEFKPRPFGASRPPREGDSRSFKPRGENDSKEFRPRTSGSDFKSRPGKDGDHKSFGSRSTGSRDFKPGSRDNDSRDFKPRSFSKEGGSRDFKPGNRDNDSRDFKPRSFSKEGGSRDFKPGNRDNDSRDFKPRTFSKDGGSRETPAGESKRSYIKKDHFAAGGEKPFRKFDDKKSSTSRSTDSRPFRKREDEGARPERSFERPERTERPERGERGERTARQDRNNTWAGPEKAPTMRGRKAAPVQKDDGLIRLNRYISNAGICSRRKADELIAAGVVSVNGEPVSELGHKIDPANDQVRYNGELLKREKKIYVILNKPKDYITTTDDPQERRTVMQLVEKASRERIYPVGRLDRNTTGLLLMTNDGDLADKLSHPKNGITKIYNVELNKSLSQGDFNKIQFGLELEDGIIKPDSVSYVTGGSKREIGIQIHSGKNRIVRRIFEHLGYDVVKLDRVVYGNLTKKDLPRGRWRYLEEHELIQIKHLIK